MSSANAHGTRQHYRTGCRCTPCRAANAAYESGRARGEVDPLVDAEPAYFHLFTLQATGVGYRQAAKLAGVSNQVIVDVRKRRVSRIRRSTAEAILGVPTQLAPGQRISGWTVSRQIRSLVKEGFSRRDLAQRLGLRKLQLRRRISVARAHRIEQLHARETAIA